MVPCYAGTPFVRTKCPCLSALVSIPLTLSRPYRIRKYPEGNRHKCTCFGVAAISSAVPSAAVKDGLRSTRHVLLSRGGREDYCAVGEAGCL